MVGRVHGVMATFFAIIGQYRLLWENPGKQFTLYAPCGMGSLQPVSRLIYHQNGLLTGKLQNLSCSTFFARYDLREIKAFVTSEIRDSKDVQCVVGGP